MTLSIPNEYESSQTAHLRNVDYIRNFVYEAEWLNTLEEREQGLSLLRGKGSITNSKRVSTVTTASLITITCALQQYEIMADKRITDLFDQPIYFDPPDNSSDVILEGSDSERTEEALQLKYKEIEQAAHEYLRGQPPFLISAQLDGPFTARGGWKNPWKKEPKSRKSKVNLHPKKASEAGDNTNGHKAEPLARARGSDERSSRHSLVSISQAQSREQSRGAASKFFRTRSIRDKGYPLQRVKDEHGSSPASHRPSLPELQTTSSDSSKSSSGSTSRTAQYPRASNKSTIDPLPRKDILDSKHIQNISEESEDDFELDYQPLKAQRPKGDAFKASSEPTLQTANQPQATKGLIEPLPRKYVPPLNRVANPSMTSTSPNRNEEMWLKKKLVPNNSLWETPVGSTPTPAAVATEASNKRKHRAPIVRTSSKRSAGSSIAEPASNQTGDGCQWQYAQPSRTSSFGDLYTSMGTDIRRHSSGMASKLPPAGLLNKDSTPLSGHNVTERIVTASASKRILLVDRQDSLSKRNSGGHSVTLDPIQNQRSRSPSWNRHSRASSGTAFAQSTKDDRLERKSFRGSHIQVSGKSLGGGPKGRKTPEIMRSPHQEVAREFVDNDRSSFGLHQDINQIGCAAETPLGAQIGSFSKYQLSIPKFDFDDSQSENPAGDDFTFSFNGGAGSQILIPSIEPASRPASSHSQSQRRKSNPDDIGRLQSKRYSVPVQGHPSAQAVPASRFIDHSFLFSKAERSSRIGAQKSVQGARESTRSYGDAARGIVGNDVEPREASQTREARLRSMTFEEDESPGFMGPRQKRHKEKTMLKKSQPLKQSEFLAVSKYDREFETQAEDNLLPAVSVDSSPNRNADNVPETSRAILSTVMTVNTMAEPTISENFMEIEKAPIAVKEVAKPSRNSPKLVISAIVVEHISPEKLTSPVLSPEMANPAIRPLDSPLPSQLSGPRVEAYPTLTNAHSPSPQPIFPQPAKGSSPPDSSDPGTDALDKEWLTLSLTKSPPVHKTPSIPKPAHKAWVEYLTSAPLAAASASHTLDNLTQIPVVEENEKVALKPQSPPKSQLAHSNPAQNLLRSPSTREAGEPGLRPTWASKDSSAHKESEPAWSFNDTTLSLCGIDSSARLAITPETKTPISRSASLKAESTAVVDSHEETLLRIHTPIPQPSIKAKHSEVGIGALTGNSPSENIETVLSRPSISVEDIFISSDDEDENIPHDKPVQIVSLRNSYLSPIRKRKRPKKSAQKSLRKSIYRPYGLSSSPLAPEKVNEYTPIQSSDKDPVTNRELHRQSVPQSPWNVADERALSPTYPTHFPKTPVNNSEKEITNSKIHLHSDDSRIASTLQTSWDESEFEYFRTNAASNRPEIDSEIHHSSQAESNCLERLTTPDEGMSELRPFKTFATPSPKQHRSSLVTQEEFPDTQALVDAALNNPWASTKAASTKRVSFAPTSDNENEAAVETPRLEGRQRLISPPPASDDSINIDGPQDKLARRLRAAKTLKIAGKLSSSPGEDAIAQAFIAADTQTYSVSTSVSKRNRGFEEIDGGNTAASGNDFSFRPTKRQYRPSQTWEDNVEDNVEDELDAKSSFEITPESHATPVKNGRATATKKISGSSSSQADKRGEEDIASLVENNLDEVIFGDVSNFLQGWDVDEEVRKINGKA